MTTRTTTSWSAGIRRLTGRHRWLTLIVVGVAAGMALVVTGVMTFNAALSLGVVAAMLLMHVGGHGMHGGHTQHGPDGVERSGETGHAGHGADAAAVDRASEAGEAPDDDGSNHRSRAGGCH